MHISTSTPARRRTRVLVGALAGVTLAVGAPLAASAHVHVTPESSEAETSTTLAFSFSHGCEDFPTTALIVDIPDGVTNVTPVDQAGWTIERTLADNGTVTRVSYAAAEPVENGIKGEVRMDVRFSADLAESTVVFPVTQECTTGSTAWTEIAAEDEAEPEHPAPVVAVGAVADDDGHGHAGSSATPGGAADGAEDAAAGDDASATGAVWLGAGGLALGAAALAVAITALVRRRA
jgi:uncharacterized protein YcnI